MILSIQNTSNLCEWAVSIWSKVIFPPQSFHRGAVQWERCWTWKPSSSTLGGSSRQCHCRQRPTCWPGPHGRGRPWKLLPPFLEQVWHIRLYSLNVIGDFGYLVKMLFSRLLGQFDSDKVVDLIPGTCCIGYRVSRLSFVECLLYSVLACGLIE